jgi:hypothetical protein
VAKYNQEKTKLIESAKKPEVTNDWPDLSDTLVEKKVYSKAPTPVKTTPTLTMNKSSPVNLISSKQQKPNNASKNLFAKSVEKEEPKSFSWGSSKPSVVAQSPPQFSLLDVMNEELNRMSLKSTPSEGVPKKLPAKATPPPYKIPLEKDSLLFKGWNLDESQPSPNANGPNSFANIIEMEKRSKEQYNKLKNRQLSTIQLEEKAVEDLRRLYDVDNVKDMTIRIEFIEDSNLSISSAPIWKKN